MSTEVEDFLEHFGVKGQKWGVRRDIKNAARADKAWQKNIYSTNGALRVHNEMADLVNNSGALTRLNSDPKYKNVDVFRLPNADLTKSYLHEFEQIQSEAATIAVRNIHGVSPSGGYSAKVDTTNPQQYKITVVKAVSTKPMVVEHSNAAPSLPPLIFDLDQDTTGRILGVAYIREKDAILEQSDEIEAFLEHFGRKGMKWGVRSAERTRVKDRRKQDRDDPGLIQKIATPADKKWMQKADKEAERVTQNAGAKIDKTVFGDSPSGKITAEASSRQSDGSVNVTFRARLPKGDPRGALEYTQLHIPGMAQSDAVENFLSHYGRKGMKWGVITQHPGAGPGGVTTPTGFAGKRPTSHLTDADMKAVIDRMKLEQEYSRLTARPPSKGKEWASKTVPALATMAVMATGTHLVGRELSKRFPKGSAQELQEKIKALNKALEEVSGNS